MTSNNINARTILIQRRTMVTIVIVVIPASQLPVIVGRAPDGVVSVPLSPPPPPPCDCVRTGVDAGDNPATLAFDALLPWRYADTVRPIPLPLFMPPSLIVTPLVLWCGCLFCSPHQQAMQQPAGPCRTPPPSPPTVIDLISLCFGACVSLFVADCCLLPPPVISISIGGRKGLDIKMAALLM